ncbi:MAG: nuclear transport factor 2 family protein [Flavobacteriales bacterium]|nr:nuclear transport factor 2 family protein [Flavobacteriales bacterium]
MTEVPAAYRIGDAPSDRPPTPEEAAVLAVHEQFWQSYARRDLDGRFAVCAEDVTFFGTALHERAVGKTRYRAMNQKGVDEYPHTFTIQYIWLECRIWGDTAWVEGDTSWIMGHGEASTRDIVRQTTILKREGARWWVAHVHGSDPDYRLREGEYMTHGNIHARNEELERQVSQRTAELRAEKRRSDELLLNILPLGVAEELKVKGTAEAKLFDLATILFTDFKGFTRLSERLSPTELVTELNTCFRAFDDIITARGIEKIKTIGDSYMAAGGLPDPSSSTPADVVFAALEMQDFMKQHRAEREAEGKPFFEMRVGIHSGPVVAGIVGVKKFAYDIWGDTVNIASRMESSGEVGQVNISEATYRLVVGSPLSVVGLGDGSRTTDNHQPTTKSAFTFTPRGKVQAKGKGELEMYFVTLA